MKGHKKYKITIEDESRLQTIASWRLTPLKIVGLAVPALLLMLVIGYLFVLLTPAKNLIPGYFRASERAATEQALLRADSLMDNWRRNEIYLENLKQVFDIERIPTDSINASRNTETFSPDSLLPASAEEVRFAKMIQEREKFNVTVKASLSAEGMLFYPISDEGVVTLESRDKYAANIILPKDGAIMALADGSVLARYFDAASGGYSLILQHDNGFVSRYSGLGSLLVGQSDIVTGGQILSKAPLASSGHPAGITVELWHNGNALKPYDYITTKRAYLPDGTDALPQNP